RLGDQRFRADYNFFSYNLGLSFSSLRRQAFQNVGPRAGIVTNIEFRKGLEERSAEKIYVDATLYAPGLHPNHNLKVSGAYQKESLDNRYQYSDRFVYVRGYNSFFNNEFSRLSVDYGLPLLYPDFGILGLTYFKRIRANLFYDYGVGQIPQGDLPDVSVDFSSVGVELIFDNTVINLLPVSIGLRQSYLLEVGRFHDGTRYPFEVFLGVGI
ncbi:MAG: hypothetical protein AB8F74_19275, partial [Saprospiraceae bacterium]